ncbi:hypothetical protein SH1V18_35060 [Vallitalea longa]|uniref:Carrier domain-containing protein n=1 Tax=Vallitalea longa TaxID=2936439 RepID=A0A9W5YE61_9FIRM|nr:acyl carrier protein [Vallitalea longa]GKX31026.1 hypothetical protein SH1V18_35060 [Vallitalea longa]
MTSEAVREKIIDIIVRDLEIPFRDEIKEDTLMIDIGMDSISIMTLLVYIEESFGLDIGDDFIIDSKTQKFGDILRYILCKVEIDY